MILNHRRNYGTKRLFVREMKVLFQMAFVATTTSTVRPIFHRTAAAFIPFHRQCFNHHYHGRAATAIDESSNINNDEDVRTSSSTLSNINGIASNTAVSTTTIGDNIRVKNKDIMLETTPPSDFPLESYEPRDFFRYELIYQSKKSMARVGRIHTPHGIIDTPGYVAVATNGALKGVDMRDADACGQQLIFCNSYHLLLHPGPEIIEGAGGLHKFMNRPNRPIITDSGGFQVFSLAYGSVQESLQSEGELKRANTKKNSRWNSHTMNGKNQVTVTEDGVDFVSYRDGRKINLTPESTVRAQKAYGADIIIPLDQLPPYHIDNNLLAESVNRSHRWEARSLKEHLKNIKQQAMYCVVHGGVDVKLRTESVKYLTSLPFDGYSIGGSLGKNSDELHNLLTWMMPMFDEGHRRNKPRHLLGIADEESILRAVTKGIDTFDSCYPTRISRHGTLLTRHEGKIHIKSGKHSKSYGIPIDPECNCKTCTHYDRAYLWHLYKAKEPVFLQLAAVHNIQYMNDLMAQQRQDILDGKI